MGVAVLMVRRGEPVTHMFTKRLPTHVPSVRDYGSNGSLRLLLLGLTMAFAGACQDAGGPDATASSYCEVVARIDAKGQVAFANLPEGASAEQLEETQRQFVGNIDQELDELIRVAPPDIEAAVTAYVSSLRELAVSGGSEDFIETERKVIEYEQANCSPTPT